MVGAIFAFYKYGDRTEVVAKSLEGTKEALDSLLVYIAYDLGQGLLPLVQRLIETHVIPESLTATSLGEEFSNAISDFVGSDVGDLVKYGKLLHARQRWSTWAKKLSWALLTLIIWQGICTTCLFIWTSLLDRPVVTYVLLFTVGLSVAVIARCFTCIGIMLYHHDQVTTYRENIL